ncbi:Nif3-like dinuclear metal center hexameric protein [Myceligenerans pegani]|uniref:GTP cyclohydrolase 1 type 2 homolog n=1 Tax=Myceligenerans pegani TaxID=2776917 RepID=A0ABR9MVI2_9MICO|nr:Nif3-like dinuclear metal center hexameric protein [Myceligenerans sp. TRM 65318]MBE1875401.1 Nif3-like dinuclear metal center hexameric protein [Myceligenerans sp. TRM 65318]MBE3017672.1 Nif3-like dinuclear metal center hexameric protein [Myceligenerans sp. TRM 65318]
MSSASSLADVVRVLDGLYPPGTAEGWDAVGLVAGDPVAEVRRVLFAVDPVADVVDEALEWGADLLVTHHPLFLRGTHSVAATTFKGSVVHRLVTSGCALHVAHTNADAAPRGVADALADRVGIAERRPLVAKARAATLARTTPAGAPGTDDAGTADAEIGIGRVGTLTEPVTLRDFARRVADALPATAQGIRFSGDPGAMVRTAAVVGGSGDSLFDDVRAADADVYVTSDLRHHPASELRERARFEAFATGRPEAGGTPFLVDTAHFASEWPWLAYAAEDLAAGLASGGLPGVETRVSDIVTDPWTGVAR